MSPFFSRPWAYDEQQIMDFFYPVETFHIEPQELRKEVTAEIFNSGPGWFKKGDNDRDNFLSEGD